MYYFYFLLYFIIVYLIYFAYFKIKLKFWSTQPVFHYHNVLYWLFPKGLIHTKLIPNNTNKYYEPLWVKTIPIKSDNVDSIIQQLDIQQCFSLIQQNYLQETQLKYIPNKSDIDIFLQGHNHTSYISYFFNYQSFYNSQGENKLNYLNENITQIPIIKSVLLSRPLYVKLNRENLITNYVDFLCTGKKFRKQGITPKLINTFGYQSNQYNYNFEQSHITSYFFKNEAKLTQIVPFIVYKSYFCDLKYWTEKEHDLYFRLTLINKDNINMFLSNFQEIMNKFENFIHSDQNNLIKLIKNKQLFIFCTHYKDNITDWYFFKNTHVQYKDEPVWECIGSLYKNYENNNSWIQIKDSFKSKQNLSVNQPNILSDLERKEILFINNFYNSVDYLKNNYKIKYIDIENIGHNHIFLKNIIINNNYISSNVYNYYFYNFIYRPQLSNDTLILC